MNKKKVHINYTCNKSWDSLCSTSGSSKYCNDCDKMVGNYFQSDKQRKLECGAFDISQVSSFKRSFQIGKTVASVSLLTLLGLTFYPTETTAQDKTQISETRTNSKISIKGQIVDKNSNRPVEHGMMEIIKGENIIAVTSVRENGHFEIELDTTKHKLNELSVYYFYDNRGVSSDTTKLPDQKDNAYLIEMNITTDYDSKEYFITGNYHSIEENDTCDSLHFRDQKNQH